MSGLVAYGASDDSDDGDNEASSDAEEPLTPAESEGKSKVKNYNKGDGWENGAKEHNLTDLHDQISDEEDYNQTAPTSIFTSSSLLWLSEKSKSIADDDTGQVTITSRDASNSYSGLPAHQNREEVNVEEAELEDEVKQKPAELAEAPKPPPKRARQPVKITIPSLNNVSDDEDEQITQEKLMPSKVRSGLFSLLPAPIHSSKKEINRPLIPHTVSKKSTPVCKPSSISKYPSVQSSNKSPVGVSTVNSSQTKPNILNNLSGYDDSDDDNEDEMNEPNNFFSLGNDGSKKMDKNVAFVSSNIGNGSNETNSEIKSSLESNDIDKIDDKISTKQVQEQEKEDIEEKVEPGLINDSPLDFGNASRFTSWSSASSSYLGGIGLKHPTIDYTMSSISHVATSGVQYNMVDTDGLDRSTKNISTELTNNALQQMMNDKEFQKLHGKRKRGMEEISFVDANVDDYVDPSELSKHITEETEYSSSKNKDDMPTSQQRRKKQITYLAFQAKEKELELKNTWSQNKLTRRQTQAKYGF